MIYSIVVSKYAIICDVSIENLESFIVSVYWHGEKYLLPGSGSKICYYDVRRMNRGFMG